MSLLHKYVESTTSKQHRLSVRQYNKACKGLFLPSESASQIFRLQKRCKEDTEARSLNDNIGGTEWMLVDTSQSLQQGDVTSKFSGEISSEVLVGDRSAEDQSGFVTFRNCEQLGEDLREDNSLQVYKIEQKHSYACLDVTADEFDKLCSMLGIFQAFKDLVIYLGHRTCEVEVATPRPKWKISSERQGSGLELAYGLRWMEENDRSSVWSLRQSIIYNKFDHKRKGSKWMILAPSDAVHEDLNEYLEGRQYDDVTEQAALHLALIYSSIACWRSYLVFLTERVGEHVRDIKLANPKDASHLGAHFVDLAAKGTRLKLKGLEDQITDAVLALEANKDTMEIVLDVIDNKLQSTCRTEPAQTGNYDYETACARFRSDRLRDVHMLLKQLRSLHAKLTSCTQIASSFSELSNGHILQQLARDTREESEQMTQLTRRSQRDGAAVKALTVITLVYLPTTVVLNFFSASFIDTNNGEIELVGKWWLFLVVCAPLTILTICGWKMWVWRQSRLQKMADNEDAGRGEHLDHYPRHHKVKM